MAAVAPNPSHKRTPPNPFAPASPDSSQDSPSSFSGLFRIPQAPQRQSPFATPHTLHRDAVSQAKHSKQPLPFATPAPPKRRTVQSQLPLRPSSLPRPIRSVKSSFNLSSLSESMETDPDMGSTPTEASQSSPWSAYDAPSTPAPIRSSRRASYANPTISSFAHDHPANPNSGSSVETPLQVKFYHERTASTYSEPDILAPDQFGSAFFTPQQKLVKPNPAAFHSTGLLSKKNRPIPTETSHAMPETPLKKGVTPGFMFNGRRNDIFHATPATAPAATSSFEPGTPTGGGLPPTPTRYQIGSVKSKHYRSPLQESPIKNSKKMHLNGDGSPLGDKAHAPLASPLAKKTSLHTPSSRRLGAPRMMGTPMLYGNFADSPTAARGRHRSNSSPGTQVGSLRLDCKSLQGSRTIENENSPPGPRNLGSSIESPFDQTSGVSSTPHTADSDMMDCDVQHQTPTTVAPPRPALFSARQPVQSAYNHLVTPYPLFLNPQYFLQLRARNGKPPPADDSHSLGVHPDYLDANFRITERLGRGSFAEAYKVECKKDGRFYAVKKTIHAFIGYKDGLSKLGEVEILWQIGNHPHCVCLVAAWVQYGYLYLQMELCEAGSLDVYLEDHCRDSSLEEYRIWHILAEITQGLKHIHDLNLVHLDLKPGNIFITLGGTLKIGDFGLAARAPVSRFDDREGDRTYIAPEILRDLTFGKPADVFSLGLIILEITANVILPENGPYWHKLRQGDLAEINFGEEISPALVDLVRSMLDPDPRMRPTPDAILQHPYVAQIVANEGSTGALSIHNSASLCF